MTHPELSAITAALSETLPPVMRWCGAVAKRLRQFNISVDGKGSGNANTDALTLADLSVQEILVAAMRDADPVLKQCRMEGEESTGDMERFSKNAKLAIAIDPIDGTNSTEIVLETAIRLSFICMTMKHRFIHLSLLQKWANRELG